MFSFITEALTLDNFARKHRTTHGSFQRPSTASQNAITKKFEKVVDFTSSDFGNLKKKSEIKRAISTTYLHSRQNSVNAPQKKWNKIVDQYNLPLQQQEEDTSLQLLRPGLAFYRLLASPNLLKQYVVHINFPETFLEIQGQLFQISTNRKTGQMESNKIERQKYTNIMNKIFQHEMDELFKYHCKYKDHYDYRKNVHAPVIVSKIAGDYDIAFEVDVESYKVFDERRSRPTSNKLIQRFIYPRNMQSLVVRIAYCRKGPGDFSQQFSAQRFQNVDNIFRVNKKNNQIYETFKLQSTINAAYDREDKIEYRKFTSLKGLQKFIQQSKQLIWLLQISQKVQINKILIDFTVDLYNNPWLINLKKIQYSDLKELNKKSNLVGQHNSLHISGSYGVCRVCSIQYLKRDLRKTISNKMLQQYLSHLKKRLKAAQYEKLDFVKDIIKTKTKNYINLHVCERCYNLIVQEYKLIQQQRKLAKLCNIEPAQIQINQPKIKPINMSDKLKQWRLMLYVVGISHLPTQYLKDQIPEQGRETLTDWNMDSKTKDKFKSDHKKDDKMAMIMKYKLGNSNLEHSWKITNFQKSSSNSFFNINKVDVNIKRVNIHYFYSQNQNIDNFLKQTQINFQLATASQQKIFANGSSATLSTFKSQYDSDLCLRQTSTVLLFYNNGQYCQLTIKVGLICDGVYQMPDNLSLSPLNKVYFADNSFTNSNQIPKQWMQAFGVCEEMEFNELNTVQIEQQQKKTNKQQKIGKVQVKQQKKRNKKLSRKSFHLYR